VPPPPPHEIARLGEFAVQERLATWEVPTAKADIRHPRLGAEVVRRHLPWEEIAGRSIGGASFVAVLDKTWLVADRFVAAAAFEGAFDADSPSADFAADFEP